MADQRGSGICSSALLRSLIVLVWYLLFFSGVTHGRNGTFWTKEKEEEGFDLSSSVTEALTPNTPAQQRQIIVYLFCFFASTKLDDFFFYCLAWTCSHQKNEMSKKKKKIKEIIGWQWNMVDRMKYVFPPSCCCTLQTYCYCTCLLLRWSDSTDFSVSHRSRIYFWWSKAPHPTNH